MQSKIELEHRKIHGLVQLLVAGLWVYENAYLWYCYHIEGGLYLYMRPDWNIYLNISLGLVGLYTGILTFIGKSKPRVGYLVVLGSVVFGFALEILG